MQCIDAAAERIERLEAHMRALLEDWHLAPVVKALMGFKGYQTVAAMITVSEIGDIHRFAHPRQLMAYLGLVPSESSSGGSRAQGAITKCGNGHLRWIFNECAQHYRLPPKVSSQLSVRQENIPKAHRREVQIISWRCQNRLYERGRKLAARGKTRQKVQAAMARELSAFVWEVMRAVTPQADGTHAVIVPRRERAPASQEPAAKKERDYLLRPQPTPSGAESRRPAAKAKAKNKKTA